MNKPPFVVLHLRASNFFGGPEKQILQHAIECRGTTCRIIVGSFSATSEKNEFLKHCTVENVDNVVIQQKWRFDLDMRSKISQIIIDNEVDLLCVHGYKPAFLAVARSDPHIPVIAFSRGRTAEGFKLAMYQRLEDILLPRFAAIIAVSKSEKKRVANILGTTDSLYYVPNAVRVPAIINQSIEPLGLPDIARPYRLVTAGRLSPEKGHRYLLDAMTLLDGRYRDIHLVICGDGPRRAQLEERCRSLGLADRVCFTGFRDDLPKIYEWMDVFVLPSLSEGLPNVVLEALAHGKTVVSTSVGGVPDLIDDGRTGFLAQTSDSQSLAEGIRRGFDSAADAGREAQCGRAYVRNNFSFSAQAVQLRAIYKTVMASGLD